MQLQSEAIGIQRDNTVTSRLYGILVTYRRQHILASTMTAILDQPAHLFRLYVVDNEDSPGTERIVQDMASRYSMTEIVYVRSDENGGPAGGWSTGMELAIEDAHDSDWLLTLDDNNPPAAREEISRVLRFANAQRLADAQTAGVGVIGARFNWWTGLIVRLSDQELQGPVPVDYLGGGHLAMYSVHAVRQMGSLDPCLFFGSVELEFGLRLRRAGYRLYACGDVWKERRRLAGRLNTVVRASPFCLIHWQKYYRIRNYIFMMKRFGRVDLSLRWALIQCVIKPSLSLFRSPRLACRGFLQAASACYDGFRGRMGRTREPIVEEH